MKDMDKYWKSVGSFFDSKDNRKVIWIGYAVGLVLVTDRRLGVQVGAGPRVCPGLHPVVEEGRDVHRYTVNYAYGNQLQQKNNQEKKKKEHKA